MHAHTDSNIGQTSSAVVVEHKRNTDGMFYYRAATKICSVFGADLGEGSPTIEGFGTTEIQARERLEVALREFNDSLWDSSDVQA